MGSDDLGNRLHGDEPGHNELFGLADELVARRKKQSKSASQRSQPSQTRGGRPPRAGNRQALTPLIDPPYKVSRPSPAATRRPRQQSQPSMPPQLLELRAQECANVRPGPRQPSPLPENDFDAWPPPMSAAMPMAPLIPPMDELESVDTVFMGDGKMKKVRGNYVQSWEHSVVSCSLAAMGKRGIQPGLPLQSHGTADMAYMTVVVPVETLNDWTPGRVDIWAYVSDLLEGDSFLLGRRARNNIDSVRNGHPSASKPVDAQSFGLANGYVAPAAINMAPYSPPPSSVNTTLYQGSVHPPLGNMNPGTAQCLPVSPFQNSFDHDMSTIDDFMNDTEMHPDATASGQASRMPTGTGWANMPSFITPIMETQSTTAPNPMVSGTEAAGTNGHQGESPDLAAQDASIRSNFIHPIWWSPPT